MLPACCRADWMYLAVGSGIFYDVGRSFRWFSVEMGRHTPMLKNVANISLSHMATLPLILKAQYVAFMSLRKQGYDSVQFPLTWENNMWKYEIVDIRTLDAISSYDWRKNDSNPGRKACPPSGVAAHFFSGWGGKYPCMCQEESRACLNCGADGPDPGARPSDFLVQSRFGSSVRTQCARV